MQAVELNFPNPPKGHSSWIELAPVVFETQAARYSAETSCGGGLRWQIFPLAEGGSYQSKNKLSNAVFFNLAARLARYSGNQTYGDWAGKTWSWLESLRLVDSDFDVYDGAQVKTNCSAISRFQFSSNAGVLLEGAAYMYNQARFLPTHQPPSSFSPLTIASRRPALPNPPGARASTASPTAP